MILAEGTLQTAPARMLRELHTFVVVLRSFPQRVFVLLVLLGPRDCVVIGAKLGGQGAHRRLHALRLLRRGGSGRHECSRNFVVRSF